MNANLFISITLIIIIFFVNFNAENLTFTNFSPVHNDMKLKAYVLTVSEDRWKSASALLFRADLMPIRLTPIPLNASVISLDGRFNNNLGKNNYRKYHHGKLSTVKFWREIAHDSTLDDVFGYSLIFEDDIAIHPLINVTEVRDIIENTARMSRDSGIFFLGSCAPVCRTSVEINSIRYSECIGTCLHAYGLFKWRAEWLYEELAAVLGDRFRDHIYYHAMDRYIAHGLPLLLGDRQWPYLAGSDLFSEIPDHLGIFFQDRIAFPSEANPNRGLIAPEQASA
jgi:hypothetical protein